MTDRDSLFDFCIALAASLCLSQSVARSGSLENNVQGSFIRHLAASARPKLDDETTKSRKKLYQKYFYAGWLLQKLHMPMASYR